MRVLHVPDSVGGHAPELARAERELGVDSHCLVYSSSPYGYVADEVLRRPSDGRLAFERRRVDLLRRALRDYDVVHFNFGSTILPMPPRGSGASWAHRLYARVAFATDLRLLRKRGRAIVVTFQGDDARQGDVLRSRYRHSIADEVGLDYYTRAGDEAKRRIIRAFERYAHEIYYLNPDLSHVLPPRARFARYAHVDPREWTPVEQRADPPLVVHAPSRRDVKGTRYVVEAVHALQAQGLDFRFQLIEGRTQRDVRVACEGAAVVVDQLLAGWYGGLAVEAMALGVPVVAYLRHEDFSVLPRDMRDELPVVHATPGSLPEAIRQLLENQSRLTELGTRSRTYVERWHDPRAIASELLDAYERALASVSR